MDEFVGQLTTEMTRPQQRRFAEYAVALLLPGERKSMEPLAARIDPAHAMPRYKTFQRFISGSEWDDRAVRGAAFRWAQSALLGDGKALGWVIDDTGFVKKGEHSVFVHRQYTGTAGKVCNCQVGVSLSVVTEQQSMPVDFELYMPQGWAEDKARRAECRVPQGLEFRTKPEIALELIETAVEQGVEQAPVLADSAYGDVGRFRMELEMLGLEYVVGIHGPTTVIRPRKLPAAGGESTIAVRELALAVGQQAFRRVSWREGTKKELASHFHATAVELPKDPGKAYRQGRKLWLLIEWPKGEAAPTKFWLCHLRRRPGMEPLVVLAKARWLIERDYEDLKGELGLDHFEGRSYGGWHHHVTMCIAAYAFLLAERGASFPPCGLLIDEIEALVPPAQHVRRRGSSAAA